jgi:hypothetical protein
MNFNVKLTKMWDRNEVKKFLEDKKYPRVLDIGGSRTSIEFADKYVTHILDLTESEIPTTREKKYFFGDCCKNQVWEDVIKDVKNNGLFDFTICTHTLEDLTMPSIVIENIVKVSKNGYIAVPSKYAECTRREGSWRGYYHHRWIFDVNQSGSVLGIPKINAIDHLPFIDHMYDMSKEDYLSLEELQFFWSESPDIKFVEQVDTSEDNNIFEILKSMSENKALRNK